VALQSPSIILNIYGELVGELVCELVKTVFPSSPKYLPSTPAALMFEALVLIEFREIARGHLK
jgi:hypothetical protein